MTDTISTIPDSDDEGVVDWRVCHPVELSNILRAASEAFYEQGFHGTSVRDIAGRVGVTVPALYYHHENKEAILVAVLESAIHDLLPRGEAAVAEADGDPLRELANLVRCIALHVTVRAQLAALDSEFRYLTPEARGPYAEVRKQNELLMRGVVQRGTESGAFVLDDAPEATRAILGMLQAITRWYDPTRSLTPDQIADRYVALALATVGVTPQVAAGLAADEATRA